MLQTFQFPFVAVSTSDIVVVYTNASGVSITLASSQYTLVLNPILPGQLWSVGGTVTYPIVGNPIAAGTSLTISRVLPLTQTISIANQGDFSPEVIEEMGDTLCMQIQQVAASVRGGGDATPPNVFICGTVTGTANTLDVSTTFPTNFSLNEGILVTFIPSLNNTGNATLNIEGTGNILLQKLGATGFTNLLSGDLFAGVPFLAQYIAPVWLVITIVYAAPPAVQTSNFNLTFAQWVQLQVCTSALTISVTQTTNLTYYFTTKIMAVGGPVTLTPAATDAITVGGTTLVSSTSYIIPQGTSVDFATDANGNIYLTGTGATSGTNNPNTPGGRLTLTSNTPVMTGDVLAATAVYYTPYQNAQLPIYNGSTWRQLPFTQLTMTLNSSFNTSGKVYDLYVSMQGGSLTLSCMYWGGTTARSTTAGGLSGTGNASITQKSGIWVNNAAISSSDSTNGSMGYIIPQYQGTYLGTFYASANGQTQFNIKPNGANGGTANIIGISNAYNRESVVSMCRDTTILWTYNVTAWRMMNASASNRITFVDGLQQSTIDASLQIPLGTAVAGNTAFIGVSLDSTSGTPNMLSYNVSPTGSLANNYQFLNLSEEFPPNLGVHFIQAVENSISGTTSSFNPSGNSMALIVRMKY